MLGDLEGRRTDVDLDQLSPWMEPALLAMEGRFESFTLGRKISIERVKEIYRLFRKHGFRIAGLHSFDADLTDAQLAEKRRLAEALRSDPALLARTVARAAAQIADIPIASKGVRPDRVSRWLPASWRRQG